MRAGLQQLARWMRTGAHSASEIARELRITAALPDDTRRVVTLRKGARP